MYSFSNASAILRLNLSICHLTRFSESIRVSDLFRIHVRLEYSWESKKVFTFSLSSLLLCLQCTQEASFFLRHVMARWNSDARWDPFRWYPSWRDLDRWKGHGWSNYDGSWKCDSCETILSRRVEELQSESKNYITMQRVIEKYRKRVEELEKQLKHSQMLCSSLERQLKQDHDVTSKAEDLAKRLADAVGARAAQVKPKVKKEEATGEKAQAKATSKAAGDQPPEKAARDAPGRRREKGVQWPPEKYQKESPGWRKRYGPRGQTPNQDVPS